MRNNLQVNDDSVTMISRSKSKNHILNVNKLKQKQNGWNDRFFLDHIPDYNHQSQSHNQYSKNKQKVPMRRIDGSKAKRHHQQSLQKSKVSNKPNPSKNQYKMKQAITNAFSELKSVWYQKKIPECHMEVMTKLLNRQTNPMKILEDIKHEYTQITNQTSLIQKLMSSILIRENCLIKINQLVSNLQQMQKSQIKKQFEEKISHLRILTIHSIQSIFHWKQSIQSVRPKHIKAKFVYNQQLYTKKIKQDYIRIANSKIKSIYKFQNPKIDAFFLNYSTDGKKIMNVSKNLIKRIKLCQLMLNQQQHQSPGTKNSPSKNKHKKTEVQGQKQNKNRISPVKSEKKLQKKSIWTKIFIQYGQINQTLNSILSQSEFKDSFVGIIDLKKQQQITYYKNSNTQEQILLGVDRIASQRKIIILAIKSTTNSIQFLLKQICQFMWENDLCLELRISLVHRERGDSYRVDPQFEKKLKAVGFRWICVTNNHELRITTYAIKRPLDFPINLKANSEQSYPVIIQHLVSHKISQKKQKYGFSRCFMANLDLIRSLQQFQPKQYNEIVLKKQYTRHLDSIKTISQNLKKQGQEQTFFSYSGMKSFLVESEQSKQKILNNMRIQFQNQKLTYPCCLNIVNSCYKFKNITVQDGKFIKFFPHTDNQITIVSCKYPMYLLQTDEENINFFVIEVSENFMVSGNSISEIFNDMGQQSSFIDQFWLPIFQKQGSYTDELGMDSKQFVSTNYKSVLGSVTRKSKVRTKIVKAPFIFGIINKELLQVLQIPFYFTLIQKTDLI